MDLQGRRTEILSNTVWRSRSAASRLPNERGGQTFGPLERDARIVVTSTPRFAKMVAHKFACGGSTQVESDLAENHGRHVARSYLQNLTEAVGTIVHAKEETWHYATPRLTVAVHTVAIGLDGTCMLLCEEGDL